MCIFEYVYGGGRNRKVGHDMWWSCCADGVKTNSTERFMCQKKNKKNRPALERRTVTVVNSSHCLVVPRKGEGNKEKSLLSTLT